MISIILPYFDRQEAADRALLLMERTYAGADLEVIVVDDGSVAPFVNPCSTLNIRTITLPRKDGPKSPCICWNVGIREALGDVVVISCVEILHEEAVLEEMAARVRDLGPDGYVLAAAWCPEEERWHCHSTVELPRSPKGTGAAFCAALHPELYWRAGGFDEDYREGAGYEDCDFINRMLRAGAIWEIRDDLRVVHPKTDARTAWTAAQFSRNFDLYRRKWPGYPGTDLVNFVCLNAQNYLGRGAEYVNTLFDMVRRNMPGGTAFAFHCLTDDPAGLHPQISVVPLPADLKGWWGKLYLFKPGLFPDGERMIFLDLDTVIVGSLAEVVAYRGEIAILRDFYQPNRGAPGVIAWEAGKRPEIWLEWEAEGRPWNPLGDLGWIEGMDQGRYTRSIDRLQDVIPGKFVSFKAHCRPYPPAGASVVCFHGEPRPHNCGQPWVELVWKVGGGVSAELVTEINTSQERIWANLAAARTRGLPELDLLPAHEREVALVGGGPSLADCLDEIRALQERGGEVWALNGAADYLAAQGIAPERQVVVDARPENARFLASEAAGEVLIAATCAPESFDAAGNRAVVFYPHIAGIEDRVVGTVHLIGGGSTVGLLAMGLAYAQGFRRMHLFGYDSCYTDAHHAYPQPENDGEVAVDVTVEGRKFKAAAWMVTQVQEFQQLAPALAADGCEIETHGRGLLQHVAWLMTLKEAA